jgi:hypothetical protein
MNLFWIDRYFFKQVPCTNKTFLEKIQNFEPFFLLIIINLLLENIHLAARNIIKFDTVFWCWEDNLQLASITTRWSTPLYGSNHWACAIAIYSCTIIRNKIGLELYSEFFQIRVELYFWKNYDQLNLLIFNPF